MLSHASRCLRRYHLAYPLVVGHAHPNSQNARFTNLESVVVQVGPKECLVPEKLPKDQETKILDVLASAGVAVTRRPRGDFSDRNLDQVRCRVARP